MRSEAQKRADKKYTATTFRAKNSSFTVYLTKERYREICDYLKAHNISRAKFVSDSFDRLKEQKEKSG